MTNELNEDEKWKTLELTQVEYREGDFFGKVLAGLSLTPLVIVIFFMTSFFNRRDLHTFTYGIGLILNGVLNYFLKRTIKEPRPFLRTEIFEEYGMPSSHSQFMWFFFGYYVLFVIFRLNFKFSVQEVLWKGSSLIFLGGITVLVTYGRIYLLYHTPQQVLVGCGIGLFSSAIWFALTHFVFSKFYSTVASWKISEWLLIRDTSLIPNIFWFEYTSTRIESNNRSKRTRKSKSQ